MRLYECDECGAGGLTVLTCVDPGPPISARNLCHRCRPAAIQPPARPVYVRPTLFETAS